MSVKIKIPEKVVFKKPKNEDKDIIIKGLAKSEGNDKVYKIYTVIEGVDGRKNKFEAIENNAGEWSIKWDDNVIPVSDDEEIKKLEDAVVEFEGATVSEISVKKLVTHTCIMDGGEYAHNELVMYSLFAGKIPEKKGNIIFKVGRDKNNNWYIYEVNRIENNEHILINSIDKNHIDKVIDKSLEELQKNCSELNTNVLGDIHYDPQKRFRLIAYPDYKKHKRKLDNKETKPIFRIGKYTNGDEIHYYVTTGLYGGVINFIDGKKTNTLEIKTEYSDELFRRMLLRCCGVYADNKTSKDTAESDCSIYSLISQYLYLISLRKVVERTIPRRYTYLRDRGYNIKGNIDINQYINKDLIRADKKISYIYPERVEIQNILLVLYAALKSCKISDKGSILPKLARFEGFLKEACSGKRPTQRMIRNIHKEKCLENSLYSDFKNPLQLAQIILQGQDTAPGDDSRSTGISGYLIDVSFLWEMYLYNVMRNKISDWVVEDQTDIEMYSDRFYKKTNHPDYVLSNDNTGDIFILDAKFKRMEFREIDVDNSDLQEVHSYSYYYYLKFRDKFKGTALIYPYKKEYDKDREKCKESPMYGLDADKVPERFTILAFKDDPDNLDESERKFINELTGFLQNSVNN